LAYSTRNFNKIRTILTQEFNPSFVAFILPLAYLHIKFYCDIYFVLWDLTSTEIEML